MSSPSRTAVGLAAFLGIAGVTHFARPRPYDALIPKALPGSPRTWTYASGVVELGTAAAVAWPRTRRFGGLVAAVLFVAVFPGNVQMAADYQRTGKPLAARLVAFGRLPLQWPLITWALRVREGR
jgi:uncharacterized membrane protein